MEKLAKFLNETKPLKILDVATGAGNFVGLIDSVYTDYEEIIGIDTIEMAVKSANKNFSENEKISFKQMDAIDMEFSKGYFDIVCLSNSLHHLEDVKSIFSEMYRVLKPGGIILVAEMLNGNLTAKQLSHQKVHHFAAKVDRMLGSIHNDTYHKDEILRILSESSKTTIEDNWTLSFDRPEEVTEDEINWFLSTIDRIYKRVTDEKLNAELAIEAEEIKVYVKEYGFDSCPTLMVVMQK